MQRSDRLVGVLCVAVEQPTGRTAAALNFRIGCDPDAGPLPTRIDLQDAVRPGVEHGRAQLAGRGFQPFEGYGFIHLRVSLRQCVSTLRGLIRSAASAPYACNRWKPGDGATHLATPVVGETYQSVSLPCPRLGLVAWAGPKRRRRPLSGPCHSLCQPSHCTFPQSQGCERGCDRTLDG